MTNNIKSSPFFSPFFSGPTVNLMLTYLGLGCVLQIKALETKQNVRCEQMRLTNILRIIYLLSWHKTNSQFLFIQSKSHHKNEVFCERDFSYLLATHYYLILFILGLSVFSRKNIPMFSKWRKQITVFLRRRRIFV